MIIMITTVSEILLHDPCSTPMELLIGNLRDLNGHNVDDIPITIEDALLKYHVQVEDIIWYLDATDEYDLLGKMLLRFYETIKS